MLCLLSQFLHWGFPFDKVSKLSFCHVDCFQHWYRVITILYRLGHGENLAVHYSERAHHCVLPDLILLPQSDDLGLQIDLQKHPFLLSLCNMSMLPTTTKICPINHRNHTRFCLSHRMSWTLLCTYPVKDSRQIADLQSRLQMMCIWLTTLVLIIANIGMIRCMATFRLMSWGLLVLTTQFLRPFVTS